MARLPGFGWGQNVFYVAIRGGGMDTTRFHQKKILKGKRGKRTNYIQSNG